SSICKTRRLNILFAVRMPRPLRKAGADGDRTDLDVVINSPAWGHPPDVCGVAAPNSWKKGRNSTNVAGCAGAGLTRVAGPESAGLAQLAQAHGFGQRGQVF